jgi:hypothetical protein
MKICNAACIKNEATHKHGWKTLAVNWLEKAVWQQPSTLNDKLFSGGELFDSVSVRLSWKPGSTLGTKSHLRRNEIQC